MIALEVNQRSLYTFPHHTKKNFENKAQAHKNIRGPILPAGVATERRGDGVLRLNTKPETDGQLYLTIPNTSQSFQIIISDWIR
jgi:hypothetical protein